MPLQTAPRADRVRRRRTPQENGRHEPAAGNEARLATAMVLGSMLSVQCGAALATSLFDRVGPGGAVFLRTLVAAIILVAVSRRSLPSFDRRSVRELAAFGFIFSGMNLAFFEAIDRLPLGVVVTLEFVGPLAIAIAGSRRARDLVWALLAGVGILLLSGGVSDQGLEPLGIALALIAGAFWAAYIVQSARVGGQFAGFGGLAVAMAISTVMLAPVGVAEGGLDLIGPATLAVGVAVGILASAIPYGLEYEALRRLPKSVFGVLMSLEPAIAALIGFLALSERLSAVQLVAIGLVVLASIGAVRNTTAPPPRDV